jgi:hypothetical protein
MKIYTYNILLFSFLVACASTTDKSTSPTLEEEIFKTPTSTVNELPETFSQDRINTMMPEEILREVGYYASGGGRNCENTFTFPTIQSDPIDSELMKENSLITCGWKVGQELSGVVTYPTGEEIYQSIIVDEFGGGYLNFRPLISDPEGVYEFKVIGNGVVLDSNAYYRKPIVPGLYELNNSQLLFNNFQPNEIVRLFMFSCNDKQRTDAFCFHWIFAGWQEYKMDELGNLIVNGPVNENYFVVISSYGFEIPAYSLSWWKKSVYPITKDFDSHLALSRQYWKNSQEYRACPDNAPIRIKNNDEAVDAVVTIPENDSLGIYANPRLTARTIHQLYRDDVVTISPGTPVCLDGKVWRYSTKYDKNFNIVAVGYVIEADTIGNYFLEVANSEKQYCGGLKSRLNVGDKARVAYLNKTNKRIREKPGFAQDILDAVPEGYVMAILDGPECVDDGMWWFVHTENGLEGWMVEYQDGVYLLEPTQ